MFSTLFAVLKVWYMPFLYITIWAFVFSQICSFALMIGLCNRFISLSPIITSRRFLCWWRNCCRTTATPYFLFPYLSYSLNVNWYHICTWRVLSVKISFFLLVYIHTYIHTYIHIVTYIYISGLLHYAALWLDSNWLFGAYLVRPINVQTHSEINSVHAMKLSWVAAAANSTPGHCTLWCWLTAVK